MKTYIKLALAGAHPTEYSQTNNCIGSFAPNATCTITVTFSPTGTGAQNANLTITDKQGLAIRLNERGPKITPDELRRV